MRKLIDSSVSTLSKSKLILSELSDEQLCRSDVHPYSASVGSHIRHILDFYSCIFKGLEEGEVDLTARKRDKKVEQNCSVAMVTVENTIKRLNGLIDQQADKQLKVYDDLGKGKICIDYTLGALLAQANSHTIHHYAIISYLMQKIGASVNDASFGYNPTTPIKNVNLN